MKEIEFASINCSQNDIENMRRFHDSVFKKKLEEVFIRDFARIGFLANRKQAQIVFFGNRILGWEELALHKYGKKHTYEEQKLLIKELMHQHFLPHIERYYCCPIINYVLFGVHYRDDFYYGFSAKIFESSIFKSIGQHNAGIEEEISNSVSSWLRIQFGKGPSKTAAFIFNNKFLLLAVYGLIPPYMQANCLGNTDNLAVMNQIFTDLMSGAVDFIGKECYSDQLEHFIDINFANNQIMALVVLKSLTQDDFASIID
jgi:uncharacterized protein YbcI